MEPQRSYPATSFAKGRHASPQPEPDRNAERLPDRMTGNAESANQATTQR